MTISQRDKKIIWHPFTQEKIAPEVITVKRAFGSYLYDENDKAYLDLISSWWVNIHGHCHGEIAKAIYEQAQKLEHVMFAGFTHEPAVNLCENLQELLPPELCKFFFSDNGSTAVEVALKMAYQYWRNLGFAKKNIFLSFEGGYHGDTFGAMSVGAKSGFHDHFQELFFKVLSITYPESWENDEEIEAKEQASLQMLHQYLEQYQDKIAAIILEPLIQGASGMRICRASFVQEVIKLMRQHNILVIFDEIMTGFGRTGSYFAFDQIEIVPDFLCVSKGITGGFLPLALTITKNEIYESFLGDDFRNAFAHGHSYTANPLACSAAIASLDLLTTQKCQQAIHAISETHEYGLRMLRQACKVVHKLRRIGTISAFDVITPGDVKMGDTKRSKMALKYMSTLKQELLQNGMLIRPLGNSIYLLPPYCITSEELSSVYQKMIEIMESIRLTI